MIQRSFGLFLLALERRSKQRKFLERLEKGREKINFERCGEVANRDDELREMARLRRYDLYLEACWGKN